MLGITKAEASAYIASLPIGSQLNQNDYWFRGFVFVMTAAACCILGTINIAAAVVCAAVFGIALCTGFRFIMDKCAIPHYLLLSDSLMFLSCSVNLAMITAYTIYRMNGNLTIGFAIAFSINAIDVILMAIYARTMIKRKRYEKNKKGGAKAGILLGLGGAGLGWIMAQSFFAEAGELQELSILFAVTLLGGFLCNFGLIGFMKYYCCTVITKLDHTKQ